MDNVATVDPALNEQYQTIAARGVNLRGLSLLAHRKLLGKLVMRTESRKLLDYGSGAGDAYTVHNLHLEWGVPQPTLYDPAFRKHSQKPQGMFDGVICSDVLEHVPEHLVDAVISELVGYANKFVFASVCCRPAAKTFPDGTNLHVTVKPMDWWRERFAPFNAQTSARIVLLESA